MNISRGAREAVIGSDSKRYYDPVAQAHGAHGIKPVARPGERLSRAIGENDTSTEGGRSKGW